MPSPIRIIPLSAVDKSGYLLPLVIERIIEFAKQHPNEQDPVAFARQIMTLISARPDAVQVGAFLDDDNNVVGHAVTTLEGDGVGRWVYVAQMKVDPVAGSADPTLVSRCIRHGDEWGKVRGATSMVMTTPRSDEAWRRKYGFRTSRHVMWRSIDDPIPAEESAKK